ncbi:hypothetical protein H0O02_02375 [Candidatus Micrarchaeota archaeon]|nr:hypothetical protein [Candidatus Micrarchaeota archaeon]
MAVAKTAPDALKLLWEEGFFKIGHSYDETIAELSKKGYNFSYNALRMAMSRVDFLTKSGDRGNSKFIQKYPYHEDDTHGKPSQKN